VYEPSLDEAGHLAGPDSELVRVSLRALTPSAYLRTFSQITLEAVDEFARQIHDAIVQRNLTDIIDVIFVSDHGMTDTSNVRLVYLDDILGDDGMNAIEHEDGTEVIRLVYKAASFLNPVQAGLQLASASRKAQTRRSTLNSWNQRHQSNQVLESTLMKPCPSVGTLRKRRESPRSISFPTSVGRSRITTNTR
jgi:Type I phosphodiesterase / nucleotide pyrophosphatase